FADEATAAMPRGADRVRHACRGSTDAGRWMSFAWIEEQPFHRHAAKRGEVDDVCVFNAVPEAAAGRNQRVLERERSDLDREVHVSRRPSRKSSCSCLCVPRSPLRSIPEYLISSEDGPGDA